MPDAFLIAARSALNGISGRILTDELGLRYKIPDAEGQSGEDRNPQKTGYDRCFCVISMKATAVVLEVPELWAGTDGTDTCGISVHY